MRDEELLFKFKFNFRTRRELFKVFLCSIGFSHCAISTLSYSITVFPVLSFHFPIKTASLSMRQTKGKTNSPLPPSAHLITYNLSVMTHHTLAHLLIFPPHPLAADKKVPTSFTPFEGGRSVSGTNRNC